MLKRISGLSLVLALVFPVLLAAHEGHAHKIMGTVTMVDEKHVMVKTKEGKEVSVALTPQTKYVKGKTAASASDLKPNSRVVVSVGNGKEPLTATEVRLGDSSAPHAKH